MRDLSTILRESYMGYNTVNDPSTYPTYSTYRSRGWDNNSRAQLPSTFIEVPVTNGKYEMPVCLLRSFKAVKPDVNKIVMHMEVSDNPPYYHSTDAIMREVISNNFDVQRFCKFQIKPTEDCYYGGGGIIFDKNMNIIMMMSRMVEDVPRNQSFELKAMEPILRIHPKCFIEKRDSVQRYLIGKLMSTALSTIIRGTAGYTPNTNRLHIKVIVDDIPFKVVRAKMPNTNTSDSILKELVKDFSNELFQCQ